MSGGTGLAQGKLIELPDGPGAAFGGLEIGAIADGFQSADALTVKLFVTEGFAVTGAIADAEAAVAGEAGEFSETFWVLDIGDEEMRADETDAGNRTQPLDLGKLPARLAQEPAELGLAGEGLIQDFIEETRLLAERIVGQLL